MVVPELPSGLATSETAAAVVSSGLSSAFASSSVSKLFSTIVTRSWSAEVVGPLMLPEAELRDDRRLRAAASVLVRAEIGA